MSTAQAALWLFGLAAPISLALMCLGYFDIYFLPPVLSCLLASAISTLAFVLARSKSSPVWLLAVVGFTFAQGNFWAAYAYLFWRTSFFRIEIGLPLIVGSIPALLVYALFNKKQPQKTSEVEPH